MKLENGEEIFSGEVGKAAVMEASLTRQVNTGTELEPGGVCAALAEVDILAPQGISLQAGEEFTLYHVADDGSRTQVGIFIAQAPEQVGPNTLHLTAYDRVTRLDRDLSGWVAGLTDWPYTLEAFAGMVCQQCGLELEAGSLPGGNFLVGAFTGSGITGRQLMAWAAQAAGRFCRATPEGRLEFAWYSPRELTMTPGGDYYWFQGGMQRGQYTVAPVEKVQIRQTAQDVGAVYPDTLGEANTLHITGNLLLAGAGTKALEPVAQMLYEQFRQVTYTPMTLTVPAENPAQAGDIIQVTDREGNRHTLYIMSRVQTGQRAVLKATGSRLRNQAAATNQASFRALTGKILELSLAVEGAKLQNKDTAGNLAALELDVEGIRAQTQHQSVTQAGLLQQVSQLAQNGAGLELQVQTLRQEGASRLQTQMGYTFDDTGLHIRRQGEEVATKIDHTGMQVSRAGENVLQATAEGVRAVDISVKNYLMVGSHARLEDYTHGLDSRRTACFWMA